MIRSPLSHSCRAVYVTVKSGSTITACTPRGRSHVASDPVSPYPCMGIGAKVYKLITFLLFLEVRGLYNVFSRGVLQLYQKVRMYCLRNMVSNSELCEIRPTIPLLLIAG